MSFTCPFCNGDNFPRNTGSLLCDNCEDIRDMVRKVHPEHRRGLAIAWDNVIEMHDMYGFVKERLETEEDPVLWFVYWNMERTAVCIELFVKDGEKVGFNCFMIVRELAYEFAKNPPWEDMFGELEIDDEAKAYLIENLSNLLKEEDPAWWEVMKAKLEY